MFDLSRPMATDSRMAAIFRSHRELVLEDHWLPGIEMMARGCDPFDPELQEHTRIVNAGQEAYADTIAAIAPPEWWRHTMARWRNRLGQPGLANHESSRPIIGPYPRCAGYDPALAVAVRVGITLGMINALRNAWCAA